MIESSPLINLGYDEVNTQKKPKLLTFPDSNSEKVKTLEELTDFDGSGSNIKSLPSQVSDDPIGYSDIPLEGQVLRVPSASKPQGSAYVSVKMSLGNSKEMVDADLCVDTGADFTVCDSSFLRAHFGQDALKHLDHPKKMPRLRSATGHDLKMLGTVKVTILLGGYPLTQTVLVHDEEVSVFLLGSDAFYNRLIYDRGMYLAFPEDKYPPIPIKYELVRRLVKSVCQSQISPRSSAIIQVSVTKNAKLAGKEVLLTPVSDCALNGNHFHSDTPNILFDGETPVRNTVAVLDSLGNAFVLIENDTDDILTILPSTDVAYAELIQDKAEKGTVSMVQLEIDHDRTSSLSKDGKWPISALKNELIDKMPSNIVVQWDKLKGHSHGCAESFNPPQNVHTIKYVHDKEERKQLLDGTGE